MNVTGLRPNNKARLKALSPITISMKELIFWEKIAKYLSGNTTDEDITQFESMSDENETKIPVRDASVLFGRSNRKIQESFQRLEKKLQDCK